MVRRLVATLALALLAAAAFPVSNAYACSCAYAPEDGRIPLTDTVFYGDILRRDVKGYEATYVVAVKRVYAGRTGPVAEVRSHVSGAACGLELPSSGPAVFFARNEEDGGLSGMLCNGSRTAEDGPPAKLGAGYPPDSATSPTATKTAAPPSAAPPDAESNGVVPMAAAAFVVLGAAAVVIPRRRP